MHESMFNILFSTPLGGNNNYNNGYPSAPSNNDYPSAPANNNYNGQQNNGYPTAPAQNGYPSGPAAPGSAGRPGNQYVPPSNQQRPSGNGGFNQQTGYKY